MTEKNYFLIPYNEGQELNYVHTFEGTFEEACKIGKKIKRELQKTLWQGHITVEVEEEAVML